MAAERVTPGRAFMTRRPDDPKPEPPGGHAAQRLREFLEQRIPQPESPQDPDRPDSSAPAGPPETPDEKSDS